MNDFSDQPPGATSSNCQGTDITVYLYDPDGMPVAGEPVAFSKEGEETISKNTDADGKAHVEKLAEGAWEVNFPNRKFDEWHRVVRVEKPETWISIALRDASGKPVADEPYKITVPDGSKVIEGRLDAAGRATVDVEMPGDCKVNFPEREASDWWPIRQRGSNA